MPPKFKRSVSHEDLVAANDTETTGLLQDESEEEDFFLKGPSRTKGVRYDDGKLIEIRAQVREVEGVMRENIQKVFERGDHLVDLQDRSESLSVHADHFAVTSRRLQKAMWWQNMKMKLIFLAVTVIILMLIFVPIIIEQGKK